MSRTVAVVQARLGSRRFPEKMLADLGGHSLLEWVVTRVRESSYTDRVLVATTSEPLDDRLVAECERLGVEVRRGPSTDVLRRFIDALNGDTADAVVRVCADNPFVDPSCIDTAIQEFRARDAEYVYNHRPFRNCNYADGFGVEVVARELLEQLNNSHLSASQREHVTLALVDGSLPTRMFGCIAPPELARPELRFDVDEPIDLTRLRALVETGHVSMTSYAGDIIVAANTK